MPPRSVVTAAVQANLVLVAQGQGVIQSLGQQRYTRPYAGCFNSSAGGHFRHAIEHYQAFLQAVKTGELDYENRARDLQIESLADYAAAAWEQIAAGLQALVGGAHDGQRLTMASESVEGGTMQTSVERELEFLINHTVHHFALIAVIAQAHGASVPQDFGMAPSTLKYREAQEPACAR
ncbi:DinB family protein [Actomonas aquatica]|uniref:DinB family protein n=1 Tax=Actomonas aquatica TaxID=2866162 RepID=A0ABZ1C6W9_9BACT|nr:DinB family protein [Opitutus sp. WL0086]WRQ87153.1 DinB family protein [Opitutus sp. WL0086]